MSVLKSLLSAEITCAAAWLWFSPNKKASNPLNALLADGTNCVAIYIKTTITLIL